ncbi:hypothetical protein BH20VER1_BH20VER1_00240 [soil metagenome]
MKKTVLRFTLPLLVLVGISSVTIAQLSKKTAPTPDTGTLETMIVASGTVSLELDAQRLNGVPAAEAQRETLRFDAAADSFFPLLVFNDQLRGALPGSIALSPKNTTALPAALSAALHQLALERTGSEAQFELVVRDTKSGFVFFNVEGNSYEYDAATHALRVKDARLLVSPEFAQSLGWAGDADLVVGKLAVAANLRAIEVRQVVNGNEEAAVMLPGGLDVGTASSGPDVIVGDLPSMQQFGSVGSQVGLAVGTTSCNAGNVEFNWFAMPNTDHPVIPQNLYRMSGGPTNSQRFEQVGQSWLKHGFTALQENACGFGCTPSGTGSKLGVGCSDPYSASLNASQNGLGSRAWVNPFTGAFPSNARDHTGHSHNGISHRLLVNASDLNTTLNAGATYYAEAQYVTPHEYVWCQNNPGQCNMYNNVSYRRFNVTGTTSFSFSPVGATVRTTPAIYAWTGATITRIEPAPGQDGQGFVGYKVTGPDINGVYHYEYAINNENLDRAIQAFSVPLGCGVEISDIGFSAPLNHPGTLADATFNNAGYSNAAWTVGQTAASVSWSSETLAQNSNANALRWGTTYSYRFTSLRPPEVKDATIGFYKTGSPITVPVAVPSAACAALDITTAVSRKTHGSAGTFDVDLPLSGAPGIEPRNGPVQGTHRIVFTFTNDVVSGTAAVTEGTATISGSPQFQGNTMTVDLTGVPSAQRVTIAVQNVTDTFAQTLPNAAVTMKALWGDANSSSSVTASDVSQVKSVAGQTLSPGNFRSDLTVDGAISATDIGTVKSLASTGASLP